MVNLKTLSIEEREAIRRAASMELAKQLPFSAEGYKAHFYGIFSHYLPPFAWDWIQEFFEFYNKGIRRFGFKAHRGATKSTIWTIGFSSYILAKFPMDGVLIVQKSDSAAGKTSQAIANIIENNIGWKTMYPNLVPDKQLRWAFEGYEIQDTSLPYSEWRQKVLDVRPKDNSFVAYGWSNGGIVGMHPNWLLPDDILDEENTRSKREMKAVLDTMRGNILQTLNRPPSEKEPVAIFSYTPWHDDDFYAYIESTGLYHIMETPLIQEARPGEKGSFEWRGKYWFHAWNVADPVKDVENKLAEWGEMDFARMQLLDLTRANGINLKRDWLHEYPAEKINKSWPCYIGVDYASTADKIKNNERDYFSLSIGYVIPSGGVVLYNGYRGHVSSGEAENIIESYNNQYHPVQIGFDKSGKGEDIFYRLLAKIPTMVACPPKGMGKISKGERFEGQGGLGPLFQFSQAWVSDITTPFLTDFYHEWAAWPNGKNDDTLDSTYWMCYVAQAFLVTHIPNDRLGIWEERQRKSFGQLAKQLAR